MDRALKLTEAYWPPDTSIPIRETTVSDLLRQAARDAPNRTALGSGGPDDPRRCTLADLLVDPERVASSLLTGFEPGERVAVWAPNLPEWSLLEFGCALAGLTLVTVNPAYQRKELAYVLGQSGCAGIFLVPEYRGNPMLS